MTVAIVVAVLQSKGALLCLCSRNARPDDVLQVWRDRPGEMVLQLDEHARPSTILDRTTGKIAKLARVAMLAQDPALGEMLAGAVAEETSYDGSLLVPGSGQGQGQG